MEIYILRHGTTVWNKEYRLQGRMDTGLDPLGVEMARLTGEYFRDHNITFDRVYSSPLTRAFETAKKVTGHSEGKGIIRDLRLQELSFGVYEGRTIEEMKQQGVPFYLFKEDPEGYNSYAAADPSMESMVELCERTADFLREIVEESPETRDTDRILISAHGVCNKGLLMHIRGEKDLGRFWGNGLQPNCGVDVVYYDSESRKYSIKEENRVFYPELLLEGYNNLI